MKPFHRKLFNSYIFYKAMHNYCKASARLCSLLEEFKLIKDYNDLQTKKTRYENRFKIFEGVFYLKFSTYDQFKSAMAEICPDVLNVRFNLF